jgi:hypothetical protein
VGATGFEPLELLAQLCTIYTTDETQKSTNQGTKRVLKTTNLISMFIGLFKVGGHTFGHTLGMDI